MRNVQMHKIENNNLSRFFSGFYFGTAKPDCKPNRSFFYNVLKDYNVLPAQSLMVGDSISNDITPCKEIGMQTLYYTSDSVFAEFKDKLDGLLNEK